jgi:hypothetical protein
MMYKDKIFIQYTNKQVVINNHLKLLDLIFKF